MRVERKKKLRVRLPTAPPMRVHRPKSAYRRKNKCECGPGWLCDLHHREALEDAYGPYGQG